MLDQEVYGFGTIYYVLLRTKYSSPIPFNGWPEGLLKVVIERVHKTYLFIHFKFAS
jgi:hypothetical protein